MFGNLHIKAEVHSSLVCAYVHLHCIVVLNFLMQCLHIRFEEWGTIQEMLNKTKQKKTQKTDLHASDFIKDE